MYLSGVTTYDAAFDYEIKLSAENLYPNDPLGIGELLVEQIRSRVQLPGTELIYKHREHHQGVTLAPELCVEFKQNVGGLIQELSRTGYGEKDARVMDLLIVWDVAVPPSVPTTSYTLSPVQGNRRQFHGTTHRVGVLVGERSEMWCISLKDVLDKLP